MSMWKKPPLRCRIAYMLIGASSSASMYKCALGRLNTSYLKCKECPAYLHRITIRRWEEAIKPMSRDGMKCRIAIVDEMHECKSSHQKEVKE